MKIYTKSGDQGTTSLFGGRRISKDDLRIEAYGTIDELNSALGLLNNLINQTALNERMLNIQSYLFVIGSNLAADPDNNLIKVPALEKSKTNLLESWIDEMEKELKPLQFFVLPGGCQASSQAHTCRTICRRAERRVVSLAQLESVNPEIIIYLNRLSDFLFVLSRYLNHLSGVDEIYWKPNDAIIE
ncbi:MAG: cob(I)yrinic acid a,c-diamide adenosyltransferase [Saprospiraceae bacterium]|nr:cob(I)yrinic acid a,c-diamide adenosyltransferase [Saprospiraceae bacterium]MBK7737146.1 cob(I)yrinic acid a,c-diamide adenosyltransferase [Saprospiraceae bacterium]MBK7914259.1 cob(I)yrinic acid a,c-diamide adenosyltransferase [Saprospiraceae bacterium]